MDPETWFLWLSLTTLLLYFLRNSRKKSNSNFRLPPGPTPLPLIGSLFELGDMPHRSLARLAKTYGPVMALKLGQITTIVISSPNAAREVLQKNDQSLSARSVPDAIRILGHHQASVIWIDPSNPNWKNLRTIMRSHLFTSQKLDMHQGLRKQKVQELILHIRGRTGQMVNIARVAFGTTLNLLSSTLFSFNVVELDSDTSHELKDLVWSIMEEVGGPNFSDFFPMIAMMDLKGHRRRVTKHFHTLFNMFNEIIDSRLQNNARKQNSSSTSHDFLDELLQLENDSKLDRRAIKSMLADFFIAGSDTTSGTVEFAMGELLRSPTAMSRAQAELAAVIGRGNEVEESDIARLPFLQAVVKETLRLHPPGPFLLPHRAETSVEVGGYTFPKNSRVLVNAWAIGRDGDVWKDPETFTPDRFLDGEVDYKGRHFELLPFGSGRRMCPGLPLAHRMLHLILSSMLNSFEWKLTDGKGPADVDLKEKFGVTLALASPLPVIALPLKD